MASIVGPELVSRFTNLYFSTSKHLRNEDVILANIKGNYVIDIDGKIYENSPGNDDHATITLVGGYDTFTHAKTKEVPKFYMTERQKITIYNILKAVSRRTDHAEIASDVEILDLIVNATYKNYCG